MAGKGITEVAKAVMRGRKTPMSARKFAELRKQELEAKKEAARGIARAGDIAKAPENVAAVRKTAKQGEGMTSVVEASKKGKVKKKDLPMLKQQELGFKELTKTAQRAERNKVRQGKPSEFSDYLKVVEKQEVVKKSYGSSVKKKTTKKAYGGGMKKKTASRQAGGKITGKPKGVGCATHGYGKAMRNS